MNFQTSHQHENPSVACACLSALETAIFQVNLSLMAPPAHVLDENLGVYVAQ